MPSSLLTGVATGARATWGCLQELLLQANIEEMRCAVPRSQGKPPMQVTLSPAHSGSVFTVAREHCSPCPISEEHREPLL